MAKEPITAKPARRPKSKVSAANREQELVARRAQVFSRAPGRAHMAITTPRRTAQISSSALRDITEDSPAIRTRRKNRSNTDRIWQHEAFDYAEAVGELGALITLQANVVGLCGFPVRRWDDDQADWVANDPAVDDEGETDDDYDDRPPNVMRAFIGPEGSQPELIAAAAWNLFCSGECTLLGTPTDKNQGILWEFLSVEEMFPGADGAYQRYRAGTGTQAEALPDDNFTGRLYLPSRRFSDLATSQVKRVLPILQEIVTLTMMVDAVAKSRLAANLLFIPEEISFAGQNDAEYGTEASGDEFTDDPANATGDFDDTDELVDELFDHMTAPVTNPASAARLVPLVLRGKGEAGQYIQVIDLARNLDGPWQELRQEALQRLADGLDAPPEALQGKGAVNHWTAANIDSEFIVKHVQPVGIRVADFLTIAYLRPMLIAYEDFDEDEAEKWKIEFDPSPVIARADEAKSARDLSDYLSDEALLTANGFTKADLASTEQMRTRRIWQLVIASPTQFAKLLELIPGFEDIDPELYAPAPPPQLAPPGAEDGGDNQDPPESPKGEDGTKTPKTGADKPTTTEAPRGVNNSDNGDQALALLVERLVTAGDAAVKAAVRQASTRVVNAARTGKSPAHGDLSNRLRSVTKARVMSILSPADLALLKIKRGDLTVAAFDELGMEARSWIKRYLEDDGVDRLEADERAALTSSVFCTLLATYLDENLLSTAAVGRNGLRVSNEMVMSALEAVLVRFG